MEKRIVGRLIIFILAGMFIYCYMGCLVASQESSAAGVQELDWETLPVGDLKNLESTRLGSKFIEVGLDKISLEDAHKIENSIIVLEKYWEITGNVSLEENKQSLANLKYAVTKYPYLAGDIKNLVGAKASKKPEVFRQYKEKIIREMSSGEPEQNYIYTATWWQRAKKKASSFWQSIRNYFFKK
jgi:hypothetical protein